MHVALYARVSTARQAENDLSIPDQLRQLREWAERNDHLVIREFVEPGASATDDKRPVFQQMIAEAQAKPAAFCAIIVHSLSRFFRDSVEFGVYERRLKRHGVKVISITQQTADDAAGEMARRLFSLFDEYQSKENSKHTSRAMRENARRGFYNGSAAPFGYRTVATDVTGARGRKKKKLDIEETEAGIVRQIYDLYLNGLRGSSMGIKEIVKHLNERGILMRGRPWRTQKVHHVLSSRAYLGEHFFNVRDSRTGQRRPPTEWVMVASEPIIDPEIYERVRLLREARSPAKTPPAAVGSPTLLTGLLRCACGARLTLTTGKSGRYRYYKCAGRLSKGNTSCQSRPLPVDDFDDLILDRLAEKVFAPQRLHALMAELRKRLSEAKDSEQQTVNDLNRQLKAAEDRLARLYEAVETGILPLDETLQQRAQQLRTAKEALVIELANVRKSIALPMERVLPSRVEAFSRAVRQKFRDKAFAKRYLQLLVEEIVVTETTVTIRGSSTKLATVIGKGEEKMGTWNQVPIFMCDWRARSDSNARPSGS